VHVLCSALILISAIGCSSSTGSTGSPRMSCEDRYNTVYSAARSAVIRLGGRVFHASEASGSILGQLEVDVLGFQVELSITLSRLPDHEPGTQEPITVSVRAREPGVSDPDPDRVEELSRLEEQYLALVRERAACGDPF